MHEDEGFDDTNPGGEEQTKPLKQPKAVKLQLFRSPSGSRVRLETKKFDSPSDKVPHSESKPEWSSETVVKVNEANKIVTVLWDGDKERVDELDSSYKQLQWLNPSSRIDPIWNTNLVAVLRGAAQAPKAVIPPYSWSVRCPRSMRLVYISLVMFFGSVASQQLYATKNWYLNMMCKHVTRHAEAATHPGHTVLFASGLV
jgi:hypothetical protein